jgi:hypothetical protein
MLFRTYDVGPELHVEALARELVDYRIHAAAGHRPCPCPRQSQSQSEARFPVRGESRVVRTHAHTISDSPVVVERVELGLLCDKFLSGSFDGDEVRQVELEEEDGLLSRLALELLDRLLRLFLRARGYVHFGTLREQHLA